MLSDDSGTAEAVGGGCGGDVFVGGRGGGTAGGAGEVGVEEAESGAEVGGLGPVFLGVDGVV